MRKETKSYEEKERIKIQKANEKWRISGKPKINMNHPWKEPASHLPRQADLI